MRHVRAIELAGAGAMELLDRLTTSRLFVREGQMLHTLLLDEKANVFADAFLCLDEEAWLLLCEGPSLDELLRHLEQVRHEISSKAEISVTDLLADQVLWSVDGPYAWELCTALLGPEVLGAPYLSFLRLSGITCFRAGKTGEYGYLLLVPRALADATWTRIWGLGKALGLAEADVAALDQCALENWHFSIRALGERQWTGELTPGELQLRWRVDGRKEFLGSEALRRRLSAGIVQRVTCFVANAPVAPGQAIVLDQEHVGSVLHAGWSSTRGDWVGWALLDVAVASPGVDRFRVSAVDGPVPIRTHSPPLLDNRSLFVDPRKHRYSTRAGDDFPPLVRP